MLYFYRSNSQEYLLEKFQNIYIRKQKNPLLTDLIVIKNYGIKNWIQKKLVQELGISANLNFLFPNQFLQKILPKSSQNKFLLDKQEWKWKVLEVLLKIIQEKNKFSDYLRNNNKKEILQLAKHLADIFQEYALFCPNIFNQNIQENSEYTLQKRIWEEIFFFQKYNHLFSFLEKKQNIIFKNLPTRIFLFGISYLPEVYLSIFSNLKEQIDIHFFYKSSTKEYFGGLLQPKTAAEKKIALQESNLEKIHYQQGHELIGFAKKESEFQYFLLEYGWDNFLVKEKYFLPRTDTLLEKLQKSMFQLADTQDQQNWQIVNTKSITVQQCHNPKREVEELHRYILEVLEENTKIQPEDIVVKIPTIQNYTHYIEEVFSNSENPIPYSIADTLIKIPEWFKNFLNLPNIFQENYFKKKIFEFLECSEVLKKFRIKKDTLLKLKPLFEQSNLYWGKNLTQIQKSEPLQKENFSWQIVQEKILYACIFEKEIQIEGQLYESIGNFFLFLQTLFDRILDLQNGLLRPQSLNNWNKNIPLILEELFEFSEEQKKFSLQIIQALQIPLQYFQSEELLDFEIIFSHLKDASKQFFRQRIQGNFLRNGISFCSIQPMRNIPFAMVCFLGFDEQSFPRIKQNSNLNLLSVLQKENKLDFRKKINIPNTKNEDYYIFWEAILSAKHFFYISFIGWDAEGKSLSPSLALSIFLQFFCKKLKIKSYDKLPFFHKHYLYMFDSHYFQKESHYKNYSQYYHNLAKIEKNSTLTRQEKQETIFPKKILNENIPVEDFYSFFHSPISYYAEKILKIHFFQQVREYSKYEFYRLGHLQKYYLTFLWHKKRNKQIENKQITIDLFSQQKTPPPQIFEKYWQTYLLFLEQWKKQIDIYTAGKKEEYFSYNKSIGGIKFFGGCNLWNKRFNIKITPTKWNDIKKYKLWLEHLFLCSAFYEQKPISYWIGRNKLEAVEIYKMDFVTDAKKRLQKYIECYCKGLQEPLAWHSESFKIDFAKKKEGKNLQPSFSYQEKEKYYWNLFFPNHSEHNFEKQIKYFQQTIIQPINSFLERIK